VPRRLPGFWSPKDHDWKADVGMFDVTVSVLGEKGCPTVYVSVTAEVAIVRTPPATDCVNCGTGSARFRTAIVARSSKTPAGPSYSMRMSCGVSTVKRAEPDVTTAAAFAVAL
jgi:hypothetical protein